MADTIHDVRPRYQQPPNARLSDSSYFGKISWGAIWAALMVTLGVQALFISFGLFIGAAFGGSVPWSVIWYLITMAVSFYAGAAAAVRFSESRTRETAISHAVTAWGLATVAMSLVATWLALNWATTAAVGAATTPGAVISSITGYTTGVGWGALIWLGVLVSIAATYVGATRRPYIPLPTGHEATPGSQLAA